MRINIMSKYQVKYKNRYSYRVEDEVRDRVFKHDTHKWNKRMGGSELIELVAKIMRESDFLEIISTESEIHIKLFEPLTGEGADITIQYKRLENKENKNGTK